MMEDRAQDDQSDFTYPPVPDTYSNPYWTNDAINTNRDYYAPSFERDPGLEPSHHPYYNYPAAVPSAPTSCPVSYPNHGLGVPALGQSDSDLSPASSSGLGTATSPFIAPELPNTDAASSKPASDSAEVPLKKRTRGKTGSIVCEPCGMRFTAISSLNRHSKVCRGQKLVRKPTLTQNKVIKTESPSMIAKSSYDFNALPDDETRPTTPKQQDQDVALNQNLDLNSTASTMAGSSGAEDAALISAPSIPNTWPEKPWSIQNYVPRGPDTSVDRTIFFCDLCPDQSDRRDRLQTHKAQVHGVVEIPYMPESGVIDRPPYLKGVTSENGSKHSRFALRIYERGALSSSPCQPCESMGFDCIVSPLQSSKCAYCNYRDNGRYCGAAGVRYA